MEVTKNDEFNELDININNSWNETIKAKLIGENEASEVSGRNPRIGMISIKNMYNNLQDVIMMNEEY